ncbi:MAG TPA: hypothetical protein DHW81_00925 [Nitrospiraceae bacterium]|nr:hypothetical protein [Nitrospiraceae bacterium]
MKERQRTLVYAAIIFVVLTVSVSGAFIYTKASMSRALELELEGHRLFYGDYQAQALTPAERYKKALEKFNESYKAKKRPAVLLYIANSHYELGNYDEAIKTLKDLTNRFPDSGIASIAYYKTATAYVKKGDTDNALNALKHIISVKDSALQDMALLESGKILELSGKTEEAEGKYKELINKFPKSALINEAKARMGEK